MRCKNCGWDNGAGSLKCVKCNAPLNGSMVESNNNQTRSTMRDSGLMRGTISENEAFASINETPNNQRVQVNNGSNHLCPKCGYQISSSLTVCPACGTYLNNQQPNIPEQKPQPTKTNSLCPQCGYQISSSMKVCPACGTHLNNQQPNNTPDSGAKPQTAKKCPSCGNDVIPGAKFCPNCGKPFRMGTVKAGPAATPGTFFTLKTIPWDNEQVQYQPVTFCGDTINLNRANTDPNNNTITSDVQAIISQKDGKWFIEDKSDYHTTYVQVNGKVELHNGDIIVLGNRLFEFRS